jgi:hypothetical protein
MDLRRELGNLRSSLLKEIEQAARSGDVGRVRYLSNALDNIERDQQAVDVLEKAMERYQAVLNGKSPAPVPQANDLAVVRGVRVREDGATSKRRGKERGREMREVFAQERGLTPVKGTVYRTVLGSTAGVASATEGERATWFLGLPDTKLEYAVLLCESGDSVLDFVIPSSTIEKFWPRLSRSSGQVKFHVRRRNGAYLLLIPRSDPVQLDQYRGRPL